MSFYRVKSDIDSDTLLLLKCRNGKVLATITRDFDSELLKHLPLCSSYCSILWDVMSDKKNSIGAPLYKQSQVHVKQKGQRIACRR